MIQIVPATTEHIKAIQDVSAIAWPDAFIALLPKIILLPS